MKCNKETSRKASSYKLLPSFDFIATLALTRSILDSNLPVTVLLQGENDTVNASHHDSLKSVILSKHNTVNEFHNCYRFEKINKVSSDETKPSTATFYKKL